MHFGQSLSSSNLIRLTNYGSLTSVIIRIPNTLSHPILYFDNVRGFSSTFISLKNVNFFIGENSTGKTSVLRLIKILSRPEFWRTGIFSDGKGFNGFNEIINSKRGLKDFFEVGVLNYPRDQSDTFTAIRLRYVSSDNNPTLKEIRVRNRFIEIQIFIEGLFIKYRVQKRPTEKFLSRNARKDFELWIKQRGVLRSTPSISKIEGLGIRPIVNQVQNRFEASRAWKQIKQAELIVIERLSFLEGLSWGGPIRSEPEPFYSTSSSPFGSESTHTPYVLRDIIDGRAFKRIVKRFGTDSALFEGVDIQNLFSASENPAPRAFQVMINLNRNKRNITEVGYGVSQILPLLIEILALPNGTWFAIQQPEIHLHPRAQAAFGDLLFKSVEKDGHNFIVETHSDFIVDRFRYRLHRARKERIKLRTEDLSQVVFFERNSSGNILHEIAIGEGGAYSENQPHGFRTFFLKEQMMLIRI